LGCRDDCEVHGIGYKVGDEFSKLRGRKGNGRRGEKTMERGKGKGSRMMAYLRKGHSFERKSSLRFSEMKEKRRGDSQNGKGRDIVLRERVV